MKVPTVNFSSFVVRANSAHGAQPEDRGAGGRAGPPDDRFPPFAEAEGGVNRGMADAGRDG